MQNHEIQAILKAMTLKEKIALCSGGAFWETQAFPKYGIPALFMCDGPHGLRKQEGKGGRDMLGVHKSNPASCFPAEALTAASWDEGLLAEIGAAIGEEAKAQGVGMVLGPGANLKRNPLCGRNFEYFSEDPYLSGKLAAGFIRGMEGVGTASCLKHFAANSQERNRFNSDSIMDQRTLRELYLAAFEIAVKEGRPSGVMCAYPKLNGVHCSDSRELLTDILREEWGFDGLVVTDWGAMNDRVAAFRAGCDLNMPGGSDYMEKEALRAVEEGSLSEEDVDRSAAAVLRLVFRQKQRLEAAAKEPCFPAKPLLVRAAEQGAVLLKNQGGILPLAPGGKIAVIGHMAREPRYQGSGSSHINPTGVIPPLDALPGGLYAPGCTEKGETTEALIAQAEETARAGEAAVVFAGLPGYYESEGFDRDTMALPEGCNRLIRAVAEANPNTVVVLFSGCAVECPWADAVKAILWMGLPGQAVGEAAANLLYGRANPSGKLAETWPICYEDCVSAPYYGKGKDALYLEGIYAGYRYYDKAGKAVRWPFGYGLSYTRFAYDELEAGPDFAAVTVTNAGERAGAEVVQLYIQPPQGGVHRPVRELKGFRKVFLQPGESRRVTFSLDRRAFALWQEGWRVPAGRYTILAGPDSRNLPLTREIRVEGEVLFPPEAQKNTWYETCAGTPSLADLEAARGKPYIPPKLEKGRFTMDHTVEEMKGYSLLMKLLYHAILLFITVSSGGRKAKDDPEYRMLAASSVSSSLRCMQLFGGIRGGLMPGLLEMANGHFFRGIKRMLR